MDSFEYYIIDFFQFYGSLGYADSVIDMFSGMINKVLKNYLILYHFIYFRQSS